MAFRVYIESIHIFSWKVHKGQLQTSECSGSSQNPLTLSGNYGDKDWQLHHMIVRAPYMETINMYESIDHLQFQKFSSCESMDLQVNITPYQQIIQ